MTVLRSMAAVIGATSLLLSCGGDGDSSTSSAIESTTGSIAESSTETAATPPAATPPAPDENTPDDTMGSAPDAPAGGVGQAVVDVDGVSYEFVVIQCLRDITSLSGIVIEFQLDAVPAATPAAIIDNLLGEISADADVLAELEPVVEFGPILSIAQVADGGELLSISDLDTIDISSDGDPMDPASRSLVVSSDAVGATVVGTTTAGASTITVDATCP